MAGFTVGDKVRLSPTASISLPSPNTTLVGVAPLTTFTRTVAVMAGFWTEATVSRALPTLRPVTSPSGVTLATLLLLLRQTTA